MKKKIGSEKLINNGDFKIKIGTTDKKYCDVIYAECNTFLMPINAKSSYKQDIAFIECSIRRKIYETIRNINYIEKYYIFKFDIPESRIGCNKNTFLSLQIFLKYKNNAIPSSFKNAISQMSPIFFDIFEDVKKILQNNDFLVSKKKTNKEPIYI